MQAPAIEVAGVDLRPPFTSAESLSSFIAGTRMSKENVRNAFKYLTTYLKTTSFYLNGIFISVLKKLIEEIPSASSRQLPFSFQPSES